MLVALSAAVGTRADRAVTAGRSPESETLFTVLIHSARGYNSSNDLSAGPRVLRARVAPKPPRQQIYP